MPDDQSNAASPIIALQTFALTRKFGDLTAVDQVTLTIHKGEIFGLIGPNGAGKSTLIKMLTTLLPPTSGSAAVAGYDIVTQPDLPVGRWRRRNCASVEALGRRFKRTARHEGGPERHSNSRHQTHEAP